MIFTASVYGLLRSSATPLKLISKVKKFNSKKLLDFICCKEEYLRLYKEIEDGLKYVANKYGDERRTRLMNLNYKGNVEDAEPIEKKELLIHFTNLGNLYTQESTTLMTTRRGGKGTKIKLAKNEAIIQTINDDNFSTLLAFSNKGKMYSINIDDLPINSKVNIQQLFDFF